MVFVVSASPSSDNTTIDEQRPDEEISISNYDLSSIVTCSRICFAFEELWNVL